MDSKSPQDDKTAFETQHIDHAPSQSSHSGPAKADDAINHWTPDERARAEKKLVRKLDFRLMPMMIVIFIMNYIDRTAVTAVLINTKRQGSRMSKLVGSSELNSVVMSYSKSTNTNDLLSPASNNGTKSNEQQDPSTADSRDRGNRLDNNVNIVLTSLLAGAVAGALAKTTIAPLDRAKINFQINKEVPYSTKGAVDFLKQIYIREGFFALWRGNSATMARIIPYAAIQFTAHEQWRKILKVDQDGDTKGRRFVAGSLAGITSQSLTYPLDLARARMAVTDRYTGYKTLRQVFIKIWVKEGPKTLYRGYSATILGVIPYAGTSFFTYETLKKEYYDLTGNKSPNTLITLACGAAAGIAGQTSSYPLDIVRRRMQTMGIHKNSKDSYPNILKTLQKIYREEGIKNGFFKGLSMNWIKGPIAVGISFSTYDSIKQFLRELMYLRRTRYDN